MDGFKVVAGDIRASAREMEAAATGVSGANPGHDVADVATALPGGQSAGAATALVTKWTARFRGWHDDAHSQAERLTTAAANYDASDFAADQQLRLLLRRTGETIS
ncbi:hypothetical protein GCM10027596_06420 [Nocardioides korecus]